MRTVFSIASVAYLFVCGIAQVGRCEDAAPATIFDMDTLQHRPTEFTDSKQVKHPAGTTELVDGKFGRAVKFSFVAGASGGFMAAPIRSTPDWDQAAGFSFWVKGDGSQSWGGIELIDRDDFGKRYGYCFPIDSTEWRKISVPWRDVIPELNSPLLHAKTGQSPSHLGNFWFGKWFYWHYYPAESYTVDQVQLEPLSDEQLVAAVAGASAPPAEGLKRVRAKLRAHQPITLVTMGDSLSDERHWSNREILWSRLLTKSLEDKYGGKVTLVNPSIGGTTLSQNLILMPRWSSEAPQPDLVIVWFGGNDWNSGVRGPRFAEYLRLGIERIRRQTGGSADILLLTTCPSVEGWQTMAELEQAVRDVGQEQHTAVVDIASEFRQPGSGEEALKQEYWAWDKVHLGKRGHDVLRNAILAALEKDEP